MTHRPTLTALAAGVTAILVAVAAAGIVDSF